VRNQPSCCLAAVLIAVTVEAVTLITSGGSRTECPSVKQIGWVDLSHLWLHFQALILSSLYGHKDGSSHLVSLSFWSSLSFWLVVTSEAEKGSSWFKFESLRSTLESQLSAYCKDSQLGCSQKKNQPTIAKVNLSTCQESAQLCRSSSQVTWPHSGPCSVCCQSSLQVWWI
jgi:hypothetical protein